MDMDNQYGLKQVQIAEIEILKNIICICEDNDIPYFIIGGTLLGAVRHHGFIPWDDDIDIGLPRNKFTEFLQIAANKLPSRYRLMDRKTSIEYKNYIPRIEDISFSLIDNSALLEQKKYAWVDIFPFDGMPNNKLQRKIHFYRLMITRLCINYSIFSTGVDVTAKNRPLYEKMLIAIGKIFPVEKIFDFQIECNKLDKHLMKYDYENSQYLINCMGAYKIKEITNKSLFGNGEKYDFEGFNLNGPEDSDAYLTQIYGEYLKLPKESQRNHHDTKIISESVTDGQCFF